MITRQKTDDIQRFDRQSGTYERSYLQGLLFDRIHRSALSLIPHDTRPEAVLDIGCGTGRLLRKVAARWPAAHLIGIDPAEGMVEEARRLTPGATFYVSPAEALPLPDSSVDLVMSTTSFHHWLDQAQGLHQIARVLRPGGRFLLADVLLPFGLSKVIRHGQFVSPSTLRDMFAQANLDVLAQRRSIECFSLITIGERH
jgi:ubiquinone/menaquinone biosynthesis C-methylase UbiE